MPRSSIGVDFWGDDVVDNGLVFETGDSDGLCLPLKETLAPVTWSSVPRQQILSMMANPDGSPFLADPRQCLLRICKKFEGLGLTPVVATELEFYLFDIKSTQARVPLTSPLQLQESRFDHHNIYSIEELDEFQLIFSEIRAACEAQHIPMDAAISEMGAGQFEINLTHEANALAAADHAVMFKRIVKGAAKKHGHLASFMAKPLGDKSGSGLHVHFSLLDASGNNIFNNGTPEGSEDLRHAVAGLLATLSDSMLLFTPHANSYRRFAPSTHAPIVANWGYDNRTAAVRIPESPNVARRIEHRVAGADANPYLVLAVVLGGALHGLCNKLQPFAPTVGNSYEPGAADMASNHVALPTEWKEAVQIFESSSLMKTMVSEELVRVFSAIKKQEIAKFKLYVTDAEYETYLGAL